MSNIYLYLKTHNKTGLKYLGKTEKSDPYKYQGSGHYWQRHIQTHGYDVTTEILFETEDKEEFKKIAFEYSRKLNVVESPEFANLVHEVGDGGANNLNRELTIEWKSNIGSSVSETKTSKDWIENVLPTTIENYKKTVSDQTWKETVGKEKAKKQSKSISKTKSSKEWKEADNKTCEYCGLVTSSANYAKWHGDNCSSIKKREFVPYSGNVVCPHCGVKGHKSPAMSRWHFDNCKMKGK